MAINLANNNSLANITALPSSISGGGMTLISEQTASSSANLSFTSGIDSTYDEYVFKFIDIHPATDNTKLSFQASTDTGSSYGVTITSTRFYTFHRENDDTPELAYDGSEDLAQSTNFQNVTGAIGNGNDEAGSGFVRIFNPSSTTFVKHFIADANSYHGLGGSLRAFTAGYYNSTSALDAVQFKMSSGNIDSGVIKLYGIS